MQSPPISPLQLTQEQRELLSAPLPEWAVKPRPDRPYLSSIGGMAIHDRLRDVFGIGGYSVDEELVKVEGKHVVMRVTLRIGGWAASGFGGNDNDDLGDAFKGAGTDALTTVCAKYLGISG